jgi:hypothetical protein
MNKNVALVFALAGMICASTVQVNAQEAVQPGLVSRAFTSTKNCLFDNRLAQFVKAHPYWTVSGLGLTVAGFVVYKLWLAAQEEEEAIKASPTRFSTRNS